jgi:Uma2 family endonuclease
MASAASVTVRYGVHEARREWELTEPTMPESVAHDEAVTELKASLELWAKRTESARVVRNLAIRWSKQNPRIGVDPDVAVLSPPPPEGRGLRSVRTWVAGHTAPRIAVEVVSETKPRKDYVLVPDKYAASGTRELWVFDPLLVGPRSHGGPFRLQVWSRDEAGALSRVYAGEGPAWSAELGAHLVVVDGGQKLRIADDTEGARLWPTHEEAERRAKEGESRAKRDAQRRAKDAQRRASEADRRARDAEHAREAERSDKERERAAKERERAEKERALERVKELEARLPGKRRTAKRRPG